MYRASTRNHRWYRWVITAEMQELAELCGDNRLHYELTRELLSLTLQQRSSGRRAKLNEKLEKALSRHFYDDREDALRRARNMAANIRINQRNTN